MVGRLELRDDGPRLSANELKLLKRMEPREKPVVLTFDRETLTEGDLLTVRDLLFSRPGQRRVELLVRSHDGVRMRLVPSRELGVAMDAELELKLAPWMSPQ